jgi:hypothetical protein
VELEKITVIVLIFIIFSLPIILFRAKTGKVSLPIVEMDTPDYLPGIMIINVSEDTWIGSNALPSGCQWEPCSNGEQYCEKNCTFSHKSCYDSYGEGGAYGTFIWVNHPGGISSGSCGQEYDDKRTYLWFNMSEGRTTKGNVIDIPWYLIKNATIKLWVNSANCGSNNVTLRPVLPNDNKNTMNETIHNLVWNNHYYYVSGDYYNENVTFFGSEIQRMCPTTNTTSGWNVTDYVINQTKYGNDVFVQLSSSGGTGWSVKFSSKEHSNTSQRPYLQIELNAPVCGDGYCTPLNESAGDCPQECTPTNYIEVNGTTFAQLTAINITGWSANSSSEIYLWNDYNGTLQQMLPSGTGAQTNITLSSNLNVGVYNVSCNSTWNSTLSTKSFTVVTTTTVPPQPSGNGGGGGGGGGVVKTTTTTSTTTSKTTTTTTQTTTTTTVTTTTTIPVKVPLSFWEMKIPLWMILVTVLILVIIVALFYVIRRRRREKLTILDVNLDDYSYDYE